MSSLALRKRSSGARAHWVAFGRGVWYLWFIGWRVWGYGYRSVRAVMRRVWGYGSCETARVWVSVRVMEIVIFICENLRFALVRSSFSQRKSTFVTLLLAAHLYGPTASRQMRSYSLGKRCRAAFSRRVCRSRYDQRGALG